MVQYFARLRGVGELDFYRTLLEATVDAASSLSAVAELDARRLAQFYRKREPYTDPKYFSLRDAPLVFRQVAEATGSLVVVYQFTSLNGPPALLYDARLRAHVLDAPSPPPACSSVGPAVGPNRRRRSSRGSGSVG